MDRKYFVLSNIAQKMSGMNPESTRSVIIKPISDEKIVVSFYCIVNLTHAQEARRIKQRFDEESDVIIAQYMRNLKEEYKKIEDEKIDFKMLELTASSNFEITDSNYQNARVTSIYRKSVEYQII